MKDIINISLPKKHLWSVFFILTVGFFTYLQTIQYILPVFKMGGIEAFTGGFQQILVILISYALIALIIYTRRHAQIPKTDEEDSGTVLGSMIVGFCLGIICSFFVKGSTAFIIIISLVVGFCLGIIFSTIINTQPKKQTVSDDTPQIQTSTAVETG